MPGDSLHTVQSSLPGAENYVDPGLSFTVPLIVIGAVLIVFFISGWLRKRIYRQKALRVYSDKQGPYDRILHQYSPYYRKLPPALQERFLMRTLTFMASKRFRYMKIEPREHMPLLISAAAVQLTFGLDNYLMDHFDTIYVVKGNYNYGLYNEPFQGHVTHHGIYLSWNNFIGAFADYGDGDNVGLHEMAHALSYVNFTANDGSDDGFKQRFKKFSETGRAVFNNMQSDGSAFLPEYAATNYEEFWAVCVENFFERPGPFRQQMPALYSAMCNLLNQDMLSPDLILKPIETV